ncbi:MAG: efflux RND transporter permease subunit [Candidatus Aminicenantes bacterium]|nr:efflux RND transporter permease subunit [Candidatus Aminicenantes bacterium]
MNISRFSVYHPIFTVMIFLIVIILGFVSFTRLPIDLMPDITYPTLSLFTSYGNASPEEMEELITRRIEEAMAAVPGVEEISSTSAEGSSMVRVSFAWGTDLEAASNDIRDRLDRIIPSLPEDVERPRLRKFDPASFPILIIGASSDLDPVQARRIIDDQIKYRIERVPGVASLDIWGGREREIHVNLQQDKIKALGLPLDLILNKIRSENVDVPAGTIERGNFEVLIRTPGVYTNLDEIRETVVAIRDGVPIQIKEIATVEDSWQRIRRIVRVNGKPGIRLSISKQSGENTVEVAQAVLKEMELIQRDIPQISLVPIINSSKYIQSSISNVGKAAVYGGLLAVLVLLFFLRSFRSTTVIATAIPISIIATFALIYFGGFTLNIMTLGGLALGIGMLLDNSIVVLENIYRIQESGEKPVQAALNGTGEVHSAVIASTLTTLAVFLPLIFLRGMSGIMFKQLSYVIAFALLCSLIVALTLVPMLSSKVLRVTKLANSTKKSLTLKLYQKSGQLFINLENRYKELLHYALNHRLLVLGIAFLLFIGSLALIPLVGTEFMPAADEGEVRVSGEMEVGTRLGIIDEKFRTIAAIVENNVPEINSMVESIGGSSFRGSGSHVGEMRVSLLPQSQRSRSSEEIAASLRGKLEGIPGLITRLRSGQGFFLLRMGTSGGDQVQIEIRGYDLEIADILARQVESQVEKVDGITDAQVSRETGTPEEIIVIDRQKAADMKLTVSQIAYTLQTFLTGTRASNYREAGDEFWIRVKVQDAEQMSLEDILDLTLTNTDGQPVMLRNVVSVRPRSGPVQIQRKDQERTVTVSANISGRDMGSVIADIREKLQTLPVPSNFSILFTGDYEEQQKAFRELLLGLILALMLVYMVMASLYESLRDPFVVMFSIPLAAIGVILMLFLTNTTLNVQSYIGCIMLGGIVVNNAILLVDYTNLLRRRDKMPLREAIEEAGRRRLRPILMTATTTIMALFPLALGLSEGGEAQAPMARAVIGGLLSSTLITLVIVPVVYSVFERWGKKRKAQN